MKAARSVILRRHRRSATREPDPLSSLKILGLTVLALFLAAGVYLGLRYALFTQTLPSLEPFRARYTVRPEPTRFYARDGETLLFTLAYENFESRDLAFCESAGEGCFPPRFAEAARLTREYAVRNGTARPVTEAMVRDVYAEEIVASSRPELLVRLLTRQATETFGEAQILTWYYNTAWFGQMAFGLDAAARLYLDKGGDSLSDAECVLLSAIINAPMLNPIDSKGALRDSYLQQLALLTGAGLFSREESEALSRSNFTIYEPPHYVGSSEPDIITRKALAAVMNAYGREQAERGGMKVITSEDAELQAYLRCAVSDLSPEEKAAACPAPPDIDAETAADAAEALRTAPVSAAILDVNSGELLAALEAQTDRENNRTLATSLQTYPIGTTMNFFAALTAFSGGSTPSTLLWDLENSYTDETSADTADYLGPVSLRNALTRDGQRPLTAHLRTFGSGSVQRNAALFGLTNSHAVPDSEILYRGSTDSAESVAYSLIPFAAMGKQAGTDASGGMHPVTILRIEMADGTAEDPQPAVRKSLIAENLAYLVHNVFVQDHGSVTLSGRPSAVRIGTVPEEDSVWISGYTTVLSLALRVGEPRTVSAFETDNSRARGTAEILWRSVMEYAHRGIPVSGWDVPAGVSQVRVCLPSGKLPTAACRETATEVFLSGSEPYEYDEYYTEVPINRENRMLATRFTPPEDVEKAVFLTLPAEASAWAAANGIESVPTEYDPIRDESRSGVVTIEAPAEFQSFSAAGSEKIDVIVRLTLPQQAESMQVTIGKGMYPEQWTEVGSGTGLDSGQWLLCTLDPASLEPGLYALRAAFTLPDGKYRFAETYFEIE